MDIFVISFSCVDKDSFELIKDKWVPEITHFSPNVPFIVNATKIDLRGDVLYHDTIIRHSDGAAMAKKVNASAYSECSALTREGLKSVFDTAIRFAVAHSKSKQRRTNSNDCQLL